MKNRKLWMLGTAVVGMTLLCFSTKVVAQEQPGGPDVGQQGEFNGEHVDTGAAALDTGPEATTEAAEGLETSALKSATLKGKAQFLSSTVLPANNAEDLNVEQQLDLQEIAGPEVVELK